MKTNIIEQNYILLIMNCKKYHTKALFQIKTWLKMLPDNIIYYHVIGDENIDKEYYFDHENNVLFVQTKDDYISLPKKVIYAYKAINETFKYKYIFKTDDDQILVNNQFFPKLIQMLTSEYNKIHYGGFLVKINKPKHCNYHFTHPELPNNMILNVTNYCTGRFYFLSHMASDFLVKNKKSQIEREFLEDYGIGFHLDEFYKKTAIHIATNYYFTDIEHSDYPTFCKKIENNSNDFNDYSHSLSKM